MSQFLQLVDRPIAFQRSFVRLGAGITGALFLSQIVYWQNRMEGQWFYKTQLDLEEETGLTRYEQEGARKKLVSCGVLEESKRGIPAKLYFRVNAERLEEILMSENQQAGIGKTNNQGCGISPNSDAENQQAGTGMRFITLSHPLKALQRSTLPNNEMESWERSIAAFTTAIFYQ